MKNKGLIISLITLLVIISIALIIFMICMMNNKINFFNFHFHTKVSDELVIDQVYNNDYSKIDIDSAASNIYIKKSSDDKIKVLVYDDKNNASITDTNNQLKINLNGKKCHGFCLNTTIGKIEIYLPDSFNGRLDIINNYGDISIDEINANINIDEDCGNVKIDSANDIDIKSSFGNIDIKNANKIKIKTSAGDVDIGDVNDVKIESDFGDINIKSVSSYINIDQDCGDVVIDNVNIDSNSSINSDLGDVKIGSTNAIYIDAKTDLGNVKINRNNYKDVNTIILKIENDCGDISVNN